MVEGCIELPKDFKKFEMLFIPIMLNRVKGHAYVDTGADSSVISPRFAKKCNVAHLIDSTRARFFGGIGGNTVSHGEISECELVIVFVQEVS